MKVSHTNKGPFYGGYGVLSAFKILYQFCTVLSYAYTYTAYRNNYIASPFNQNTI